MVEYVFLFINMDVLLCLNVISKMQEDEVKILDLRKFRKPISKATKFDNDGKQWKCLHILDKPSVPHHGSTDTIEGIVK